MAYRLTELGTTFVILMVEDTVSRCCKQGDIALMQIDQGCWQALLVDANHATSPIAGVFPSVAAAMAALIPWLKG